MENETNIDKITAGWLKKVKAEEPSDRFAVNVMQSIYKLQNEKSSDEINYWWFLILIPVFVAGGWYLSTLPAFMAKLSEIWITSLNFYNSLNSSFGEMFSNLKNITISPFVILGFLAILSLLVVEDIFSKSRHKLNAE